MNVSGSFLFGLVMTLLTERFSAYPELRFLLVIGFLGGFTTFSSLEYEILQTVRGGGTWMAVWYVVASVVVGYTGVWLGYMLAARR